MNRYFCFALTMVLLFYADTSIAQQTFIRSSDTTHLTKSVTTSKALRIKRPKPITKEFTIGASLNTDGWGAQATKGWVRSVDERNRDKFYNVRFAQIEFSEHKHVKEIKGRSTNISTNTNESPKPYVYGKANNFYSLRLTYGNRKMIAGKPEHGTVSIHWLYAGGLSIGFLKPYYVDAYVLQDNPKQYVLKSITFADGYEESFVQQGNIIGGSGWTKGLDETRIIPGIQAKTGAHFDFAATQKGKLAVEVGIAAELYTKKIEIMAFQKSFPYLLSGYLSLQFGKRY